MTPPQQAASANGPFKRRLCQSPLLLCVFGVVSPFFLVFLVLFPHFFLCFWCCFPNCSLCFWCCFPIFSCVFGVVFPIVLCVFGVVSPFFSCVFGVVFPFHLRFLQKTPKRIWSFWHLAEAKSPLETNPPPPSLKKKTCFLSPMSACGFLNQPFSCCTNALFRCFPRSWSLGGWRHRIRGCSANLEGRLQPRDELHNSLRFVFKTQFQVKQNRFCTEELCTEGISNQCVWEISFGSRTHLCFFNHSFFLAQQCGFQKNGPRDT